ncbi:hypothetical protein VTJ83DRAFT_2945 [Remersonia thermophila]|uniref:Protein SDS23 n=1 Tax=Remersonia thermophila TaxID=72144 RepID=A0ABR4DDK8_9PEZI
MEPSDSVSKAASSSSGSLAAVASAPMERKSSSSSIHKLGHLTTHRQSFADNQRFPPPSPRDRRHPSLTQQAVLDLMNHPPSTKPPNPRYAGRDWRDIAIGELVVPEEVRWADLDQSVQDATKLLLKNNPNNVVLVRETPSSKQAVSTFDYDDLNTYLLVVVGRAKPDQEGQAALYAGISRKAQLQEAISLREARPLFRKGDLCTLPADATLDRAMEAFGSGIHRIVVANPAGEAVGVFSQLRLIEFFWNEAVSFPSIERLYGCLLRDLQIGTLQIYAVNLDAPLTDALLLMHNEGLTSVAVVDHGLNVVGNISTADVRHLTNAASLPLLKSSCMNFISVILSERGMEHGRDSFPVFHVNPYSTLAHTVAKLVATRSHRMWVVESASPSPSAPATPLLQAAAGPLPVVAPVPIPGAASHPQQTPSQQQQQQQQQQQLSQSQGSTVLLPPHSPTPPPPPPPASSSAAAASSSSISPSSALPSSPAAATAATVAAPTIIPSGFPGARLSGRLTGVVSLTDILNLFAKSSGLRPLDPAEQRAARRRRSSSASVRPSLDGGRPSVDYTNSRR